MSIEAWLERLPALRRLVQRLSDLPELLGEISLAPLRDLSGLRDLETSSRPAALWDIIRKSRREPDRTLTAFAAAELLQQNGTDPQLAARAEFGRLLAATGEVDAGVTILRDVVQTIGPTSPAAWYLLHTLRLLYDLPLRQRYLEELLALADPLPEPLRTACQIETWWQTLLAGDAQTAGIRYQLECFLQQPFAQGAAPEMATLRARALHGLAFALTRQPSAVLLETAAFHLREAVELYRESELTGLARALDTLGRVVTRLGQHDEALKAFTASLRLKMALRDLWGVGATLNGLAQQRLAQGKPLHAADLLESNLRLLPILDAPLPVVKQNQSQLVIALLTACFPLEDRPTTALPRLALACAQFASPASDSYEALAWFYNAARRWLEARQIPDPGLRRDRLNPAIRLLRDSLGRFEQGANRDERSRVALFLALALLDRAALPAGLSDGPTSTNDLDQARVHLEQADQWLNDLLQRPYLEWAFAQWAWAKRRFDDRQAHLASARHYAELTGNVLLQGLVDDSLNAHLRSPFQDCPSPLLLTPGQTLSIPLLLNDWRQRPLPRFSLRVRAPEEGHLFHVENEHPRTDELGQARVVVHADAEAGTCDLEIRTRAGRPLGQVQIATHNLEIEGWTGSGEDTFVLRQLFGVGYERLLIRRVFEGGLSGMQVLLVHPQLRSPTGSGTWNGQPCIVKLGAVGPLTSEWERYQRWVRELLPANVTRMTRLVAWEKRAGILMTVVGTTWSRGRSEHDWLLDASPFDAHYLLEQIFHRDLGLSWYTNTGEDMPARPLIEPYASMVPPLWTLADTQPPGGLLAEPPHGGIPRLDLLAGLQHLQALPEGEVAVDGLALRESRPLADGWEHELETPAGLRVCFRSPLRAEPGQTFSIRGRAVRRLVDTLGDNLRDCCAVWAARHPLEIAPIYEPELGVLRLPVGGDLLALPDPLGHLAALARRESPFAGSVIHGDLHGRNVLVDTLGQPYYIDFAKTRFGPTLYDFIKHEQYLWHDFFARTVNVPLSPLLNWLYKFLERLQSATHPLHRQRTTTSEGGFPDWLPSFEQALQTLRMLGRAYTREAGAADFQAPYALLASLMLRWCSMEKASSEEQSIRALQGLLQAALAAWTLRHGLA